MKNRVKVTIAALTIGVLAMCGNMTGYATESADTVSTQANEDGSTDAGSSKSYAYVVTYDLNGGTYGTYKDIYPGEYNNESLEPDLSKITPIRSGYKLTGWWYTDSSDGEKKLDISTEKIKLKELFPNNTTPRLTAEWTQVVTVTVDGIETGTKVAADNTISVKAPSNTLKLDKWVVNASDANNGGELKPNNNEGTIKVVAAKAENHVINIDGKETGFGITKDNAKADFVSYWSPKEGYLIKVKNEIGHPLNLNNKKIVSGTTSDALGIMSVLPRESDAHFVIENTNVANYMKEATSEYIKYEGFNNVLCNTITLEPKDVQRKIIVVYPESNEVTFSGRFNQILKNGETLSVQSLLDNSTLDGKKNEAQKEGFTKYRWTYSVIDINGNSTKAENIPSNAWEGGSSENILENKFNYSFPYYVFEFEPVWQGDVNFKLEVPEGEEESVSTLKPIEGVDVGTEITLPDGPKIEGYTFKGWKSDVSADTVYKPGSSYKVTSANVTFTGSWTVNKYKITWNQGDNESEFDPQEVAYKNKVELPIPKKTGYTFTGWKSNVEGDNTLYNKEKPFTMPSHDVTMTAQWKINTYTVTYNGNGTTIGIYTGRDDVTYNASYEIKNVSGVTPTRFGYKFLGWRKNNKGDLLKSGDSFLMPDDNVELVAQWEATSSKSYKMEQGVGYTYNGAFRINGDPSNYQENITFYVPKAGEYTFE